MAEFKGGTLKIKLDDAEETQEFLAGLILARQNNNSEYFPQLIDGCNALLQPYRQAEIEEQARMGVGGGAVTLEQ
jgi:hypothetical protein